MQSTHIWIIASTAGAFIGAASMYYVDSTLLASVCNGNDQQSASLVAKGPTETLPCDRSVDMRAASENGQMHQGAIYAHAESQPTKNIKPGVPATGLGTGTINKPVATDEEGTIQIITARLHDPSYIYSTTLSDVMQSDDMLKLSDQSRERVVQEIMGMINRGEIDARTFMANRK